LCRDSDRTQKEVVDGAALATALTAKDAIGATLFRPTLVSLATCDSGHPGSVITPGGSIAHALHAGGIPWVVASQFPLWMNASTIAVEVLYTGLLRGDDPRWVFYTLRQRLRTDSTHTHDWGSIVAYAVVPWNFEQQVAAFRNRQTRHRIEIKFDKAEEMLKTTSMAADVEALYSELRADLRKWCDEPAHAEIAPLSERRGVSGASEKRIGIFYSAEKKAEQARESYEAALKLYKQALQSDPKNHWVATQYLSLLAILAQPKNHKELAAQYGSWWTAVRWIALQELSTASGEAKAWTLGTLAELELLGATYNGSTFDLKRSREVVGQYCTNLCETVGYDGFPAFSTRRQFRRYTQYWGKPEWDDLAHAALTALGDGASWVGRLYPGPT
jgi:CHAT domain